MIHYARLITEFGPLRMTSTLNFESHHSFLKKLARSSKNWKNPALTIAQSYARATALPLETKKAFGKKIIPIAYIDSKLVSNPKFVTGSKVEGCATIIQNSIKYESRGKGGVLNICGEEVEFLTIQLIYVQGKSIFFGFTKHIANFFPDLNIYVIENSENDENLDWKDVDDFEHPQFLYLYEFDNGKCVVPYYRMQI